MSQGMAPVPAAERFEFLDALRGVALLGIVTANTALYSLYLILTDEARAALPTAGTDPIFYFLEVWFVESKFYTLFSLLFGVGFSILLGRSGAKGLSFRRFFLRRAGFLFLIGLVHGVFIWSTDILQTYALCGALLLPFIRAGTRTLLVVAALMLAPAWLAVVPMDALAGAIGQGRTALYEQFGYTRANRLQFLTEGTYADVVRLNLAHWFSQAAFLLDSAMIFKVYGCFLLGFCFGRAGLHARLAQHPMLLRRTALWGLGVGLPANFLYACLFETGLPEEALVTALAILPLSLGYAALLGLLWLRPSGPRRLQPFALVGRMALTNYLGQSVICTLLFYNTGLGLGGTMGPTHYLWLGPAVYAFQVLASGWWLARFQYGPVEWLWRMATYGRRFPIRRLADPPPRPA